MNILGKENQSFTLNVMARTRSSIWKKHTIMVLQVSLPSFYLFKMIEIRISNAFSDGPGHYSEYLQSIGENPCICLPGFQRHPDGRCIWFHDNHYCEIVHAEAMAVPTCREGSSLKCIKSRINLNFYFSFSWNAFDNTCHKNIHGMNIMVQENLFSTSNVMVRIRSFIWRKLTTMDLQVIKLIVLLVIDKKRIQ